MPPVPQQIWQRMGQLTLQQGPDVASFSDPEAVARDLQTAFTVLDVGRFGGDRGGVAPVPFQLSSATYPYGEVVINTFAGTALHSHLRSEALAFLCCPAAASATTACWMSGSRWRPVKPSATCPPVSSP